MTQTFTSGNILNNPTVMGTTTNDNAISGCVGEYISSSILSASAVTITSNTPANVTSISLTPGDWDVTGTIIVNPGALSVISNIVGGINTVSAALPTYGTENNVGLLNITMAAGVGSIVNMGPLRVSISSNTTVYLVVNSVFTVSTNKAYGFIGARRRR